MYDAAPASALWDFALAAYARPGVAPLCLELQDCHGANVMLMLHLCHCAASGIEPVDVRAERARMEPLEAHLVSPLRRARRALSAAASVLGSDGLRVAARQVQRAELAAEALQCLRVDAPSGAVFDAATARAAAALVLLAYFRLFGPEQPWQYTQAAALAAAVFPP
jgi:uncharacterized protein (TIGR02444 family)